MSILDLFNSLPAAERRFAFHFNMWLQRGDDWYNPPSGQQYGIDHDAEFAIISLLLETRGVI